MVGHSGWQALERNFCYLHCYGMASTMAFWVGKAGVKGQKLLLNPYPHHHQELTRGKPKVNKCEVGSPVARVAVMVMYGQSLVLCENLVDFSTRGFP